MNLRVRAAVFSMDYSPSAKPIPFDEQIDWYQVKSFHVENQYGTRFLFDA